MAAPSAVVNLLDLRDEEENKGPAGGRWAGRNAKGKAKAGGRQRRARNKADGKSGFSKADRSDSNVSDLSDAGEDNAGATQSRGSVASRASQSAAPPAPEETAAPAAAPEAAPATAAPAPAAAAPAEPKADATLELLKKDHAQVPDNWLQFEMEDDPYGEAKKIAGLRVQFKGADPGLTGPHFKENVWEFYMVKGSWSDPPCEACNHTAMCPFLVIPCLWPVRLCRTIQRAAPFKVKCCLKCSCTMCPYCACPTASFLFLLPVITGLTFMPEVQKIMADQVPNIPVLNEYPKEEAALYASVGFCVLSVLLLVFWWARILLGVGMKYNISGAQNSPDKYVCLAMCQICAANMRVGLHTDRAQGFMEAQKGDKIMIQVSDTVAMASPPEQEAMV